MSSFVFYLLFSALLVVPTIRAQDEEEEGGEEGGDESTPDQNDEPSPPSSVDLGDEGPSKTANGDCWGKRDDNLAFDESLLKDSGTSSIAECKKICDEAICYAIIINLSNKKCFYYPGDIDWSKSKEIPGIQMFNVQGC